MKLKQLLLSLVIATGISTSGMAADLLTGNTCKNTPLTQQTTVIHHAQANTDGDPCWVYFAGHWIYVC